ncbi:MAG: tRNA pseudouridine synthase A [Lysobacterales bacterium]|jgi:tRNA pseudouridine38-40 synthase|nr:MAG: tRNA pseudouridine synthase A [Xanthomonadales bacterium]
MRIAIGIEYDGSAFLGWQRLAHGPTLQAAVEEALSTVAAHPVRVVAAGRTDSGVHARCQVAHFDTTAERSERAWMLGGTAALPEGIAIRWARRVSERFHARRSAIRRCYRYRLCNRPVRPALSASELAWERVPLDVEAMRAGAALLLGEHDFSAFRSLACQALHPRRRLYRLDIARHGEEVIFEFEGNAFLHHMVRNIVGSLLLVGRGERSSQWIGEVLASRDRRLAGPTAEARGLVFLGPRYPPGFGLPEEVEWRVDPHPSEILRDHPS